MTRVVLDANVLGQAFVNPATAAARLLSQWRQRSFELAVSAPILAELRRTYEDPYYARRVTLELVKAAIALLEADATVVELTVPVAGIATHPEDDLVLSTVASAGAGVWNGCRYPSRVARMLSASTA